jgi:hypothetical protein
MDRQEQEGAAASGFSRHWLQVAKARALWNAGYPVLPVMRCPSGWALSHGGPPVPTGSARAVAVYDHFWDQLTPEERNDQRWSPNNDHAWTTFFQRQRGPPRRLRRQRLSTGEQQREWTAGGGGARP